MKKKRKGPNKVVPGTLTWFNQSISLTISASKKDWEILQAYILSDPKGFSKSFRVNFVNNALLIPPFRPSKKQRKTYFKQIMTLQAILLYLYFSYWFKQETKPSLISTLIESSSDIIELLRSGKPGKPKPLIFTAHCMDRIYRRLMDTHGMRAFEDRIEDFEISYIHKGRKELRDRNGYFLMIQNLSLLQQSYLTKADITGNEDIFSLLCGITKALLAYSIPAYHDRMNAKELKAIEPFAANLSDIYPSLQP